MYRLVLTIALALAMPGVLTHPRSACPNPLEGAQKMITAVTGHVQNSVKRPKLGCIKAWRKDEIGMTYEAASCMLIEFVPPILRAILKDDVVSSGDDVKNMWLSAMRCGLNDTGVIDEDKSLNVDEFQKRNRATSGEDAVLSNEWLRICVKDNRPKRGSRVAAEVTASAIVNCYLENQIDYCEQENRELGALSILYALNSMYKEGECKVVVPQSFAKAHLTCMDESSNQMEEVYRKRAQSEDFKNKDRKGRRDGRSQIAELMTKAFQFKDDYQEGFDIYNTCVLKKMYYLTSDGKMMNGTAFINFLKTNVTGWTGNKFSNLTEALDQCYGKYYGKDGLASIDFVMGERSTMRLLKIFLNCLLPKYTRICGMNNQLSEVFLPLLNEQVAEKAISMNKEYLKVVWQTLFPQKKNGKKEE